MDDITKYTDGDLRSHRAVAGVLVDHDNRILLQDHIKYDFWTFPSGKADDGEPLHEAFKKEMLEELGISVHQYSRIGTIHNTYERNGNMVDVDMFIYKIKIFDGEIDNKEPDKHRCIKWFTIDEARNLPLEKTSHPLQWYLNNIGGN